MNVPGCVAELTEICTTRPQPRFFICGRTACKTRMALKKFCSNFSFQSVSSPLSQVIGAISVPPALIEFSPCLAESADLLQLSGAGAALISRLRRRTEQGPGGDHDAPFRGPK